MTRLVDLAGILRTKNAGPLMLTIDLLLPDIGKGTVRRLLFAEIAAALHVVSTKPDVIDLYVFRSYADYAWDWLEASMRPAAAIRLFGLQDAPPV